MLWNILFITYVLNNFINLFQEELFEILKRDSLYVNELDIFKAVCHWIKVNQDNEDPELKIKIFSAVRFPLMTVGELLSKVRESRIISSDNILDAIQSKISLPSCCLKFRGLLSMFLTF